ncbi:MAG: hypothetical protein [Podoviridae sp. ctpVR23]|nr:MAG: hypothetical protein [Podoviridae sp. ctpVR23]
MEYKPLIDYSKPAPRRSVKLAAIRCGLVLSWAVLVGTLFALTYLKYIERVGG